MNVIAYYARTLNDKRFVGHRILESVLLFCSVSRRDFRLVIGDPNHPGKAIANPVVWLKTNVVMEVTLSIAI